ncbi:MAG: hypothetical protein ACXWXO_12740 [Nocardioides sp.]
MNPLMTEQLARAKAADWARVGEQRRLANLATRLPSADLSPHHARGLAWWGERMRAMRDALMGGANRATTATRHEESGSGVESFAPRA